MLSVLGMKPINGPNHLKALCLVLRPSLLKQRANSIETWSSDAVQRIDTLPSSYFETDISLMSDLSLSASIGIDSASSGFQANSPRNT